MILKILINVWRFVFILDVLVFFYLVKEITKYVNNFFDARNVKIKLSSTGSAIPIIQILILSALPIINLVLGWTWIFNYNEFIKLACIKLNEHFHKMGIISDKLKDEFYYKVIKDFN
jgi:hypothetical protein|uniref:Uncharacterized protein n=1 Tax=Bacteriophage sp. TaxID=38018 RepID=A0A8D9UHR7_9VIRU|nr:MAG TPA: hypothetical protein [Bacteriophage sp.]